MSGVTQISSIPNAFLTVYSRQVELEALPLFRFREFTTKKTELGVERGETVQFLKIDDLAMGKSLDNEFDPMPRQILSDSVVSITVKEWGNAVTLTNRAVKGSYVDLLDEASTLLARNYSLTLDTYFRDVYLSTGNVQYAGGSVSDATIAPAEVFNTSEIKDAVETLRTLNVSGVIRNGQSNYICFAHPHQLRSLRDDPGWQRAREYVDPSDMYSGEVGRYEGVVFIETTQMPITAGAGQGGQDVYSAVIFGDRAVGWAETMPVRIADDGVQDFGRYISIGWNSLEGAGIIHDYIVEMRTS